MPGMTRYGIAHYWLMLCLTCMPGVAWELTSPDSAIGKEPVAGREGSQGYAEGQDRGSATGAPPALVVPDKHPELNGQSVRDLGKQDAMFGSMEKAQAALDFMRDAPGKARYVLMLHKTIGRCEQYITFVADLNADVIAQVKKTKCPGGVGDSESSEGFFYQARARLRHAAAGHQMNDLPGDRPEFYIHKP